MRERDFDAEMDALRADKAALDALPGVGHLTGKWVVVRGGILRGIFDDFGAAGRHMVNTGGGPALIHRVGDPPVVIDLRR
ncbi:hypothetical protein [Neoroseomonas rubea]|uniref:hypothetical protein n=1 Tax=Neoroseomonas rubea TaxID=2748666 RepID=UPI0018DF74D9|nr:hypothetical protein [Roseomonas rubea]